MPLARDERFCPLLKSFKKGDPGVEPAGDLANVAQIEGRGRGIAVHFELTDEETFGFYFCPDGISLRRSS
jgi:hypothetical protein